MRNSLFRGLAAATLAVTIAAAPGAQPAQAAPPVGQAVNAQFIAVDWVTLAVNVATAVFSGGGASSGQLRAAVAEIRATVDSAKADIINHADALANAEVQACVKRHTIQLGDIDVLPPPLLQIWAGEAIDCATLATEYFRVVQNMAVADNLGYLIGEIHTIALVIHARAGLSVDGFRALLGNYVSANESIVARLAPRCEQTQTYDWDTYVGVRVYTCTAYNGDTASDFENWIGDCFVIPAEPTTWCRRETEPIDRTAVEATATRNTSRPAAIAALPRLRAIMG